MGFIKKAFAQLTKKNYGPDSPNGFIPTMYGAGNPFDSSMNSDSLLNMYSGWVFSCGDVIGDAMAGMQMNLYSNSSKKETLKDHKYMKLLDSQLMKYIAIMLKLIGSVYIYKEKAGNKVIGLTALHSPLVQEVIGDFGKTLYYIYNDGNTYYKFDKDDLIVIKTFTPLFHRKGTQVSNIGSTPLKAAAIQVAMDMSSIQFNNIFFKNGARPGTIISHEKSIKEEDRNKYLRQFKEEFGGLGNSFKTVFMDQGIKLDSFAVNQKDMEFTEQRKFTMDEILMIFRVPKPLLGKSDGVGFADRGVPGYYFMEYNIKPLAKLIQDAFNKSLFDGKEMFEFSYVDTDQLAKEYKDGLISINEYRIPTGKAPIKEGDVLWDGTDANIVDDNSSKSREVSSKSFENSIAKSISYSVEKQIKKNTFGTDEYNQELWDQKIARTDKDEQKMVKIQRKIWKAQQEDIIKAVGDDKSIKKVKDEDDLLDEKKYAIMYTALYTKFFTDLISREGAISIGEISSEKFAVSKVNKWIGENIDRMAKDLDKTTRKEIFAIIKEGNESGVGVAQIKADINKKFDVYAQTGDKGRVEKIVRTEITDASNKASNEAYKQSGVVEAEEWFASLDERLCPICEELHGKIAGLDEAFVKKGDSVAGVKLDYKEIGFPSAHTTCRCSTRPVILEEKAIRKEVKKILNSKGINYD